MGLRLHVLYLGKMEFPKFRLVDWKDENEMVVSPAVSLLIQHPTLGNILYDTGNSEHFAALYSEEMLHNYPVTECITIEEALAEKGLKPEDIDLLIISHLHFDHAGGLSHFVSTKAIQNVIVSEADLKEAYFSVMTGNPGAYTRALFDVEGIQSPVHNLVNVVAKEQGRVIFLLQRLDALNIVKELIRGLVDGAAGGQLLAVALGGVDGVAGGDDVPVVLGVQDEADDTGGGGRPGQ